jgi:SUKH-3 immunity protein/YwqJ-like deaminase
VPAGHLTRGGDRHAELLVVSDALHALDLERAEPLSQEDARAAFAGAQLQALRVREPGDPEGGQPARPCESCLKALVYFGVLEWPVLAFAEESRPPHADDIPDPGRFPPPVAEAMVDAGWRPRAGADALAAADVAQTAAVAGLTTRHQPSPAAERVLTAYRGLVTKRSGPGEDAWIRRFTIRAFRAAHTADPLADLGRLIGTTLFPIGTENDDAILAVDPSGRVFALDQAGEWFVGPDIDAALTNLLLGRAASRIRDDGTW